MLNIVDKVREYKASKQRVYPCHVNRASQIGHPCERYLVYMRTAWDKMELPEVEREFIFAGGHMIENMAVAEIKDAGFVVSNQGRDFLDDNYKISGHIDCFISVPRPVDGPRPPVYPCEIKGISPFDFDKINSIEDMTKSDKPWTRAYPAQLQIYMFLANKEEGLFYIKSKVSFVPKQIWCKLDYEYCEELLKRCERINKHVAEGTLPDKVNEYKTCKRCQARHFCQPDIDFGAGVGFIDDQELTKNLECWASIKETALKYKSLDQEIKEGLKVYMDGRDVMLAGGWLIEKKVARNGAVRFNIEKEAS